MTTDRDPSPLSVRAGDIRRQYRLDYPILLSLALSAAVGGLTFLTFPETWNASAIGEALPLVLERAWALLFTLGGLFVLISFQRVIVTDDGHTGPDARYQAAGLVLLAGCYLTYVYALIVQRSLDAVTISLPVYVALGGGCLLKAIILRFPAIRQAAPWRQRS
jgi:hypothetical protein